eukprot:COSAG04_NODE_5774_length_1496_cov_1.969936_1_plen_92_part_10
MNRAVLDWDVLGWGPLLGGAGLGCVVVTPFAFTSSCRLVGLWTGLCWSGLRWSGLCLYGLVSAPAAHEDRTGRFLAATCALREENELYLLEY